MSEVNDNESPTNEGTDADATAAPRGGTGTVNVGFGGPETRSERWMKYGLNVLLTSLLVVALAVLVVWAAQRYRARGDLTSAGNYSLKPQTITVIGELKAPVKVVSLYPRLKHEPGTPPEQQQQDFYQAVDDILQEYKRKGKNIEVESIDPVAEPAKLDKWLADVIKRYGGNVGNYRELLEQFPKTLAEIKKVAAAEVGKMTKLPEMQFKDERQAETMYAALNTVRGFPTLLDVIAQDIQQELEQKIPDYKGRVRNVEGSLNTFSRQVEAVRKRMEELQNSDAAPPEAREYAKGSLASYEAMKKQADDVLAKIKGLGELKLDEVRKRLVAPEGETPPPAIAVMGESDIKLIDFKDVWKSGESTGMLAAGSGAAPRYRFAGEQQLTAAILSLSQPKKTKVVFVRGGGDAKTTGGMMGQGGECSEIAQRLRGYNFEVLEKDVSGQSAQRAMMGGMPPPQNEPSDEEIKDAVWVVFAEPQMSRFGPMPGGSPELEAKLKEHLDRGGSAMVLTDLNGDALAGTLKDWGITVRSNMIAVHEPVVVQGARSDDFIEDARRQAPIFVINEYGGPHPITDTLQALDAALVPMLPVEAQGAPGVEVTKLLPVPQEPRSWAEGDVMPLTRGNARPTFDPKSGDIPGPLYAGAAAERKDNGGRLVVIGCARFPYNFLLGMPDQKVWDRTGREVARFPGNGELFTNSVFWLAKMDKMIALSPSALDTPRIQPMSKGMLAFWRIGVLLVGLPLLAVVSGLLVWQARRD